jgi:murein DD-endopeptidase MepM/ murein hydrolase activator NlpD
MEIDRLKEAITRSKSRSLQVATVKPVSVQVALPTWVHPLASGKRGNSCYRTSKRPSHGGVDLAQPKGTVIRSVAAGTVYRKAYQGGGAGYYITIRHAGNIFSQYHHLKASSPLGVGARVSAGQTIGYVGATGNATGNHLHFEIRTGSLDHRVNPAPFMRDRGINIGC